MKGAYLKKYAITSSIDLGPILSRGSGLASRDRLFLFAAVSTPMLWVFCLSLLQSSIDGFPYAMQMIFCFGSGGTLLVCAAISAAGKLSLSDSYPVAIDVGAGFVLALCAVVQLMPAHIPAVYQQVFMLLGSIALGALVLRSFFVCCLLDIKGALALLLLSFAVVALFRLMIYLFPFRQIITVAVLAVLSPTSFVSLRVVSPSILKITQSNRSIIPTKNMCGEESVGLRPYLSFLGELLLCGLVLGMFMASVESFGSMFGSIVNYSLRFFIAILILVLFDAKMSKRSYKPAQTALIAVLLILFVVALIGGDSLDLSMTRALFSLARNCALIAVYLVAIQMVVTTKAGACCAIGLLRGTYECAQGVGVLLNASTSIANASVFQARSATLLIAGIVLTIVINRLIIVIGSLPSEFDGSFTRAELGRRCEDIGRDNGLTIREIEILSYLCQDITNSRIADELCVSVNTVRWHTQHIYEKLGVHSHKELKDLIERSG